jgi:mono/diheme cytochrome c family protein
MHTQKNSSDRQVSPMYSLKAVAVTMTVVALFSSPTASAELGDARRGRAYAEAVCAQCHVVTPAETVSPRPEATPFSVISRLPGLNERALGVFLQTPHAEMPNLVVTGQERDDLISYIISLRGKQ